MMSTQHKVLATILMIVALGAGAIVTFWEWFNCANAGYCSDGALLAALGKGLVIPAAALALLVVSRLGSNIVGRRDDNSTYPAYRKPSARS